MAKSDESERMLMVPLTEAQHAEVAALVARLNAGLPRGAAYQKSTIYAMALMAGVAVLAAPAAVTE